MEPRIETISEKKLIGKHLSMSMADNKTGVLWRSFMPMRGEITNRVNDELISMQVYTPSYDLTRFNLDAVFEKWAVAEVTSFTHVPDGMETFTLQPGLYAVFLHKGDASRAASTFQYIFETWLPQSGYVLDQRPHFEVLGAKYKNDDPDSEEEVWIPVSVKNGSQDL